MGWLSLAQRLSLAQLNPSLFSIFISKLEYLGTILNMLIATINIQATIHIILVTILTILMSILTIFVTILSIMVTILTTLMTIQTIYIDYIDLTYRTAKT